MDTKVSPPPVVTGRIRHTSGDACLLDLGEHGSGRLKQDYSLARDLSEPLERLPNYQPGCELQVCLESRQEHDGLWHVNERWAHNKTWNKLQLQSDDKVKGTVISSTPGGYFVRLDAPDIEVWLPEREIPWADGSLGEDPRTERVPRFPLEVDDPVLALITHVHFPPNRTAVSIRRYLEKQEQRTGDASLITVREQDPASELRFRARIEGDLDGLRRRLVSGRPLAGQRLLVIDDDPATLEAMVLLLEQNGAQVESIQVKRRLSEVIESVQAALDKQGLDLILIDYSLPGKREGLHLAQRLRALHGHMPRMVLFSGYPLEGQEAEELRTSTVDGFMRKPLHLDKLLACLQGETVWETGGVSQDANVSMEGSLPALETRPAELLAQFYQRKRLHYAILLEVTGPHRLEQRLCQGEFPRKRKALDKLLLATDLKHLSRGYWREFHIDPEGAGGNESLRPLAKHARFLTLGGKQPPRFILGLGWDAKDPPFNEWELRAFVLLLDAQLEQETTWQWVRDQLPFLVQGQLLIGLSHEIRARLSPWLYYQQALRASWRSYMTSTGEHRQAQEAAIERALIGMERAYGGLHELLEMMLGGLHQRAQVCRLRPLLKQLYQLFEGELKHHGIRLEITPAPDLSLGFSPLYLLQPLSNLILNSRKHMHRPVDGRVRVTAEIASASQDDPRQWLVVEVEDNGPGIPAHVYPHIFEPGYSHAPRPEERTGMGLYVSRLLARRIGGELEVVENWRGSGCRFRLRLPLLLAEDKAP